MWRSDDRGQNPQEIRLDVVYEHLKRKPSQYLREAFAGAPADSRWKITADRILREREKANGAALGVAWAAGQRD